MLFFIDKDKTSFHDCIIAVTKCNGSYLIESNPSLDDIFDGCDLRDNIGNENFLPKKHGIYKCKIKCHSYKCNHPLDPEEIDIDITIESYEHIQL